MLTLRFEDGSDDVVIATTEAASELYDALWLLSPDVRGAVAAAAKVVQARRITSGLDRLETLRVTEGDAVRAALASLP